MLLGHAKPHNEPVVAHGPFVMNTQEEIRKAYVDYQQGKFGVWPH
ncbi:MAG TPA: pirin-like C-terminal cupin domain-containing protein [Flavisolibacter sp.]|nr:pirin-like C-terminal cupin domain-containing protein [Flavisolibacter sp.]